VNGATPAKPSLQAALQQWWAEGVQRHGLSSTIRTFVQEVWDFVRESTPEQKRRRYGDVEYDWDHAVNTTSATVSWRDRLLGVFHSAYQPTDPAAFHQMLAAIPADISGFTFIDLGSGKGRTLMMASEYPFGRIVGVELLPELNRVACENLQIYKNEKQRCFAIESICGDARSFEFPPEPTVLYLFNPLPEPGLRAVIRNLEASARSAPRPIVVLYYNPVHEHVLAGSAMLRKLGGTHQFSVFATAG
jgi:SAM-dependent methyltransferase